MDPVSFLVQFALSYLMARLQQPNGPRLSDTPQGIGDYGAALTILLGEQTRVTLVPIAEQLPFKETVHKHKPVLDYLFGLVGALLPAVKTYTYSCTLGLLIADRTNDAPIEGLSKIYGGGKVLFDASESAVVSETLDGEGRLVMRKYGSNRFCSSVTVYGGGFDQLPDPVLERDISDPQPGYRGSAYVVIENLQLTKDFGNSVPAPFEGLVDIKAGETLADAVEKICAPAGIDTSRDLSSTELVKEVLRGYAVTSADAKCWDAVKPLLTGFGADCAEVGGQVRFYKRSRALRATLEPKDLGGYAYGDSVPPKYTVRREPDVGLPREASLTFIDPARDYAVNTLGSRRSEGDASSNINVSLALVMTADEGASAVEMMLWDAWLGRRTLQFTTTDAMINLEVGRAYALPIATEYLAYRITRHTRGLNGIHEVEAQSDEDVTYAASVTGSSGVVVPPVSTIVAETRLVAIDGPIVKDTDDEYGFYVVVAGGAAYWNSGSVQASTDGTNYSGLVETSDSAIIGDVTGTLAAGPTDGLDDTLDTTAVLTVVLLHSGMTLSSATDAELDAFANFAFVGKDGLGEYLQFKTATHVSGSTWQLTNLRRGRKGTDWAIAGHASGEEFALLTDGGAIRLPATTTDGWGVLLHLRGVTFNQDEADADVIDFTNTGEGKRPYSPVEVEGSWDGSNNLTISWTARSRLNAGGLGIDDQPNYEVEILVGAGRTIPATGTASAAYSAADQTLDGLTPGDSITGRVRQLSDVNNGRWRNFFLAGPGATLLHMEDGTTPLHLEDGFTPFELG